MYYRARYYSPKAKRFISEDPIGQRAGPNVYAYVAANPLSYRDPYGLEKINLIPVNDRIYTSADAVRDNPKVLTIVSHGSSATVNGMSHNSLAKFIRESGKWKSGMPVILNSCNAGKGDNSIAELLAKELNTQVVGPDQQVWSIPYSKTDLATPYEAATGGNFPDFRVPGNWILFSPEGRMAGSPRL
jgi:uncharacterized protein RhaS with RHS repeats